MPTSTERFVVNASWLLKLRWVAAMGQLLTVATVVFLFRIEIPMLWALLTIILFTAVSNLVLSILFGQWLKQNPRPGLPTDLILGFVMIMDMLSLTALLFSSGGPGNPFILFFFVNQSLSALVLSRRWAWLLSFLSIACFAGLLVDYHQMPQLDFGLQLLPLRQSGQVSLVQTGLFVAFSTCSCVIVYFMTRLTGELHRQQRDLRIAQELQSRSEKIEALGTLAAGAAHELATPLTTIAFVARDVEKAFEEHPPQFPGAEEVVDDVHLIRSQLDRCRKILDRMASHAGETVGKAFEDVPMEQLVNEVLGELPEKDSIELNLSDDLAVRKIEVPVDSICQALRGLLQNALDAGNNGVKVRIDISLHKGLWMWQISDTGQGMSSTVLQRISEPFFTTKPPGKGMGLGLFLARNVIQRLGGRLDFQSEEGLGTVVTVILPETQHPSSETTHGP